MWNISSEDVERAKERVQRRRSEIEARHAEELKALDTESEAITVLERAAAAFASKDFAAKKAQEALAAKESASATPEGAAPKDPPAKKPQEDAAADPALEPTAEAAGNGDNKPGSRWRLHLGNRPAEAEGGVPLSAQR